MLLFNKKEPEQIVSLGKGVIPVDKAKDLSSKGFTEPEIINVLRNDGFSAEEIDRALTQVMRDGIAEAKPEIFPQMRTESPASVLPVMEEAPQPKVEMPVAPETTLPQEYYYPVEQYQAEDYVSPMVSERFRELEQRMAEFSIKSGDIERKINQMFDQLSTGGQGRPIDQQLLFAKIDGIKDTVDDVETKVGSLERAFKETLPALIESVRALSDLVARLKREAA